MKRIRGMPFLASRVFGTPLAIWKPKLEVILAAEGGRIVGGEFEILDPSDFHALLPAKGSRPSPESITQITPEGIAMLDVNGSLVHRSSWMDAVSGLASYESLSDEFEAAVANPKVKGVLLCLNSPGGEVSGMFEMAERIHAAREKKPIHAVASDMACSAAYLLGAACERFYATESAVAGSIGVVMAHMDVSEADKKAGIKVTYVHAGDRKVDGNPHEPLTGDALASIEHHVQRTAEIFHARADKYRRAPAGTARATQAAVYVGADAQSAGLIDGVRSTRQALDELIAIVGGQRTLSFASSGATRADAPVLSVVVEGKISDEDAEKLRKRVLKAIESEHEVSGSTVAPASEPPPSGEDDMKTIQELEAALAAAKLELEAKNEAITKLTAENAELRAEATGLVEKAKAEVVEKHVIAGRVTPAMRADVDLMAKTLTPAELDARLSKWTQVTRPVPTGSADAQPGADVLPSADPLRALNEKAKEIQAATPGLTFADAFSKACFANPSLYSAHRTATTIRAPKKGA